MFHSFTFLITLASAHFLHKAKHYCDEPQTATTTVTVVIPQTQCSDYEKTREETLVLTKTLYETVFLSSRELPPVLTSICTESSLEQPSTPALTSIQVPTLTSTLPTTSCDYPLPTTSTTQVSDCYTTTSSVPVIQSSTTTPDMSTSSWVPSESSDCSLGCPPNMHTTKSKPVWITTTSVKTTPESTQPIQTLTYPSKPPASPPVATETSCSTSVPPAKVPSPCFSTPSDLAISALEVDIDISMTTILMSQTCTENKCAELCLQSDKCRAISHEQNSCLLLSTELDLSLRLTVTKVTRKYWNRCSHTLPQKMQPWGA